MADISAGQVTWTKFKEEPRYTGPGGQFVRAGLYRCSAIPGKIARVVVTTWGHGYGSTTWTIMDGSPCPMGGIEHA